MVKAGAPQLEPRSRYSQHISVSHFARPRSPATPRIHNPCILVLVQDGDSFGPRGTGF